MSSAHARSALWNAVYGTDLATQSIISSHESAQTEGRLPGPITEAPVLRRIVAGDSMGARSLEGDQTLSVEDFCERCLTVRDPAGSYLARMLLRERARVALHLLSGAGIPCDVEGLCRIWEEAVRGEARIYDDGPGRLRTESDHVPFAHGRLLFDDGPVPPGLETTPGREVAAKTEELLAYMNDEGIPCELRAFVTHWLVFRIHPFVDGNGRLARMLAASLLARHHGPVTCLAYVAEVQRRIREVCRAEEGAGLDGSGIDGVVAAHVGCFEAAREQARHAN